MRRRAGEGRRGQARCGIMPATSMLSLATSQRGRWVVVLMASLVTSLVVGQARAQDPDRPGDRDQDTEVAGPLAPVPELPSELTPPPRLEVLYAQRLGQAGRHAEEAEQLEALWRELGDPRLLYHAAMARSRAGQHMLALQQLTRMVEQLGPMSDVLRAFLDAKIAGEQAQLVSVRVLLREQIGGASQAVTPGPDARVTVEAAGVPAMPIAATTLLRLDPGAWTVRALVPGFLPIASPQRAEAGPGEAVWVVLLAREPAPQVAAPRPRSAAPPRFVKDRKLVIGVTAAMGVAFYTGVGFAVGGANIESRATKKDKAALMDAGVAEGATPDAAQLAAVEAAYPTATLHRELRRAATFQTAGAAVMMTGLGAVFGILPSLFQSKRRAAYIELGVGGVALVGGAVWMHDYLRRDQARLGPSDPEHRVHESGIGHRLGASMLTGLGIGMTLGSGLLLLTDHLSRRKPLSARIAPYGGQGQAGLLVRGVF